MIGLTSVLLLIGAFFLILYLSKCEYEDPVPKENMSEWQQQITNKLIKSNRSRFENKLWNNVCPLCGKDMKLHTYGSYDQFSDHWCLHCGFITKCQVLC